MSRFTVTRLGPGKAFAGSIQPVLNKRVSRLQEDIRAKFGDGTQLEIDEMISLSVDRIGTLSPTAIFSSYDLDPSTDIIHVRSIKAIKLLYTGETSTLQKVYVLPTDTIARVKERIHDSGGNILVPTEYKLSPRDGNEHNAYAEGATVASLGLSEGSEVRIAIPDVYISIVVLNGSGGYYPGHGYTKSNIAFVKKDMVNFGCPYKPSQFVLAPKGGDKDNAYADEAVLAYIGLREGSRIEFVLL